MGEKIRDLKEIGLKNETKLMVELNKGTHSIGKYDIHIQNPSFRLNMTEYDFCRIATAILFANENLKYYKVNKGGVSEK